MLRSRGIKGLPRDFEWHPDGKKLYFLSSGGDAELYYVNVDDTQNRKFINRQINVINNKQDLKILLIWTIIPFVFRLDPVNIINRYPIM